MQTERNINLSEFGAARKMSSHDETYEPFGDSEDKHQTRLSIPS